MDNLAVIHQNKLNRLIIASQKRYLKRRAAKGPEGKVCPVCHGENQECQYFEPLTNAGFQPNSTQETFWSVQDEPNLRASRLAAVKEKLTGHVVTVSDFDGQYTLDLGKSLIVAERYLNLDQPLKEMPLLKEVTNWFFPEGPEQWPLLRIPFSSLVIQVKKFSLLNLDDASRELIDITIREELAQSNDYSSWEWVPVLLQGKEVRDLPEKQTYSDAVELLDKRTFSRCQERLYQHYADIEEEFLTKITAENINERCYPCGDYQQNRAKIEKTLKQARGAIIAELNTIKEGQNDE